METTQHVRLDEVIGYFDKLEDPRSTINKRHPLVSVVVIAMMAVLAGAGGPSEGKGDVARFGKLNFDQKTVISAMFDIRPFLNPDDPWLPTEEREKVLAYYASKYRLAALLEPRTILEIGVRAGYSGAAFLAACPRASYTGIDADVNRHGGTEGMLDWARKTLPERFPEARLVFHKADTQAMSRLPGEQYDLIHVDGDHSYEGCLHDLELAGEQARWILVDDVNWIAEEMPTPTNSQKENQCKT